MDIYTKLLGLAQIISSFGSTTRNGFGRVLSFTGRSFNDRTGLIAATVQSSVSSPAATTNDAFDIEAATPAAAPDEAEAESKRISKSVGTVSVFTASASLAMFVSLPKPDDVHGETQPRRHGAVLYVVSLAFVCLALFTSLMLLMHSIVVRSGKPEVARVQKTAMVVSLTFVLVSFTLRVCAMLPATP